MKKNNTFKYPHRRTQVNEIHEFLRCNEGDWELIDFYLERRYKIKQIEDYALIPWKNCVLIMFPECWFYIFIGKYVKRTCGL